MKLKYLKIISIIISFALCFPLHFLYDKFPCFLTSVIAPVNESIWEHMKILFGSIIISGIIELIIIKYKKITSNNVLFANFIAAIFSIPIFLIIYLPIYNAIGENLPATIFIMLIAIVISEIISCFVMKLKPLKLETISIFLIILTYVIFGVLTYFTPQKSLFLDPVNITYGIS